MLTKFRHGKFTRLVRIQMPRAICTRQLLRINLLLQRNVELLDFLKPIPVGFKSTKGDTVGPGLQTSVMPCPTILVRVWKADLAKSSKQPRRSNIHQPLANEFMQIAGNEKDIYCLPWQRM